MLVAKLPLHPQAHRVAQRRVYPGQPGLDLGQGLLQVVQRAGQRGRGGTELAQLERAEQVDGGEGEDDKAEILAFLRSELGATPAV